MIAKAIDERVTFVVLAGDIFDGSRIDTKTGFFFVDQLRILKEANIHVYIGWGNHDAECTFAKKLPLDSEFIHVFPSENPISISAVGLERVALHGQSYPTRDVSENLAASYPEPIEGAFNIGVLHCNVGNIAEHETYAPCSLNQLVNQGYQYWALGHVHSHNVLHQSSDSCVVYPGNLQGRHIRETGPKGGVIVHVKNNMVGGLEFVDLSCVRWHHLEIGVDDRFDDVDKLLDHVAEEIKNVSEYSDTQVVRVTLLGNTSLHQELHYIDDTGELDFVDALTFRIRTEKSNVFIERVDLRTRELNNDLLASMDESELSDLFQHLRDTDVESTGVLLQEELKKFRDAIPNEVLSKSQDPTLTMLRNGDYTAILKQSTASLGTFLNREDD